MLTKVIAGVETVDHPSDAQLRRLCEKISHSDGPYGAVMERCIASAGI